MSKERLYYVKRNDSWHSYEFLEQRKNDPKWRQAFLEAEAIVEQEDKKRKRRNFIILIVLVPLLIVLALVGLYFYGYSNDEEVVPKREVTLNNSVSASTDTEESTIDTSSVGQVLTTPWGEQVTVLRVLPNGERVIKESYSPSDLNNDGVLTYEELSKVEEQANRGGYQQQTPQQGQDNQQQTPQQGQNNYQQQTPQQPTPSQNVDQQQPANQQETPIQGNQQQNPAVDQNTTINGTQTQ